MILWFLLRMIGWPDKSGTGKGTHQESNLVESFFIPLRPLILTILLFVAGCDISRHYDAAMLLADIVPDRDIERVESAESKVYQRKVNFNVHGQSYTGHLYLPEGTVRAGVVVIPGAAEKGWHDQRLIAFAAALSRVDLAVFVPDLPSLRELEVNSGNIQEIEAAVLFLAGHKEFAPQGRTGLVAFSYTAGPAVLAACKPTIASKVSVILTIGGYYSLPDVLTFITTGDFLVDDTWQHIKPNPYGQWVFVKSNLHHLDDQADRALFRQMINRKKADFDSSVDDLVQQLGLQGLSLYRFINNRDRSHVETLYANLPEAMRAEVNRLDLANKNLDDLEASLILVHGYDDRIIPFSQSAALDQALPPGQAELYLVDGLMHVDGSPGLVGRFRMWRALALFLTLRDAGENY